MTVPITGAFPLDRVVGTVCRAGALSTLPPLLPLPVFGLRGSLGNMLAVRLSQRKQAICGFARVTVDFSLDVAQCASSQV